MTAALTSEDTGHTPRQRERRQRFGELLVALTRALDSREVTTIRGAFEESLRRLVAVRSIQLRESSSRWIGKSDAIDGGAESIVLDVPGADPSAPGLLEATFDPGCRLGEWDFQMLGVAAHVGGLVLEIERTRNRSARTGPGTPPRARRDGAAPLIGSTPAMRVLRSSIERVAGTDFTVLLEGASDPQ
jgi:hypothetical protein